METIQLGNYSNIALVQCASPQNCWLINCNITRLCSPTVCPQCAEIALHVNKMAPAVPFSPHQQSQHCPDIHYENTKLRSSTVKIFMEMPSSGQVLSRYLWKYQAQVKYCQDIYGNAKLRSSVLKIFMKIPSSGQGLSRWLWKCKAQVKYCQDIYENTKPRSSIVQLFMKTPDTQHLRASIVQICMEMPDTLLWSPNPAWDELNVKITTIDQ